MSVWSHRAAFFCSYLTFAVCLRTGTDEMATTISVYHFFVWKTWNILDWTCHKHFGEKAFHAWWNNWSSCDLWTHTPWLLASLSGSRKVLLFKAGLDLVDVCTVGPEHLKRWFMSYDQTCADFLKNCNKASAYHNSQNRQKLLHVLQTIFIFNKLIFQNDLKGYLWFMGQIAKACNICAAKKKKLSWTVI